MKNNQLLPFERNRYYAGKMLTSADFRAEQTYMNNKRRFVNNLMFGSGIVCGCGVVSLDDLSVLVESGVAIDDYGREIVIENSDVKKLSSVSGFEGLRTRSASLCLRYKEDEVHSVYALNQQEYGKEFEYNRINENYEMFLMDKEDTNDQNLIEDEFYSRIFLLENTDYTIYVQIPSNISRDTYVKLSAVVIKKTDDSRTLDVRAVLQLPVFQTVEGKQELVIGFSDIVMHKDEVIKKDYWIKSQNVENDNAEIVVKKDSLVITCDNIDVEPAPTIPAKIVISSKSNYNIVSSEIGKLSLEMRNISGKKDYIILADIDIVRTESTYMIEKVDESRKEYISAPANAAKRAEYMGCFMGPHQIQNTADSNTNDAKVNLQKRFEHKVPQIATGSLEIALGDRVHKGDIRYSGEIMHGLGKGDVYVSIGYENIREDVNYDANVKSTYYGNPALFKENTEMENVTTAIKVLNDKGSFIVAARIDKPINQMILNYRWTAIKLPKHDDNDIYKQYEGKSISAVTPTVVVGTKESHYFEVKFNNMEACSIVYELTEPGSGEITADGVYTAPMKEGVYEIMIYCADMPVICTYAYAIVKRLDALELEN